MKALLTAQSESRRLRSQGFSILQIAKELGVAKSSVSLWVRDVVLSPDAQLKIEQRKRDNYDNAQDKYVFKRAFEQKKYLFLGNELLSTIDLNRGLCKILLAFLWWCEGNKNFTSVRFTNSDPQLVRVFMALFRKSFDFDSAKFRVLMHIYSFQNEGELRSFWSDVTGIPTNQFYKSYNKVSGKLKKAGYKGCIAITYFDAKIAKELRGIFEAFSCLRGVG